MVLASDGRGVGLTYSAEMYTAESARQMADQLGALLKKMAAGAMDAPLPAPELCPQAPAVVYKILELAHLVRGGAEGLAAHRALSSAQIPGAPDSVNLGRG